MDTNYRAFAAHYKQDLQRQFNHWKLDVTAIEVLLDAQLTNNQH